MKDAEREVVLFAVAGRRRAAESLPEKT